MGEMMATSSAYKRVQLVYQPDLEDDVPILSSANMSLIQKLNNKGAKL